MAEQYKKPYLESSVFIAWIKGEAIPQTNAEGKVVGFENRADIAKHILGLAEAGQFHIYTSSITIAEVHKGSGPGPEVESRTIDFFRNGFVKVIDVDRSIGESAHRFCRKYHLKPYDAVHLACALRAGCDVLLTWDSDLLNIRHDGIGISKPQAFGQAVLDLVVQLEGVPPIVATVVDQQQVPDEKAVDPSEASQRQTGATVDLASPKEASVMNGDDTPSGSDVDSKKGTVPSLDETASMPHESPRQDQVENSGE